MSVFLILWVSQNAIAKLVWFHMSTIQATKEVDLGGSQSGNQSWQPTETVKKCILSSHEAKSGSKGKDGLGVVSIYSVTDITHYICIHFESHRRPK